MNYRQERVIVVPLLFLALFSLTFLYAVSYSSASFQKQEVPFPDYFGPASISPKLDKALNDIAIGYEETIQIVISESKEPLKQFFGLQNYKYGQPMHTSIAGRHPNRNIAAQRQLQPAILGITSVNPAYAQSQ